MDAKTKEKIERFVSIVEKIKSARFTKETKTITFRLDFEAGQPLKQEISGFDEDALRSMLWDIRKLTMERDDVRLPDICDLIIDNTSDEKTIANITKCKENYALLMKEPPIKMTINGKIETGKTVMKKWLYGHYAHEKEFEKDLAALDVMQPSHRANFVVGITDLIVVAACVANNAKIVLAGI